MNLGMYKRVYEEDGTSVPTAGATGYPSGHTYTHRTTGRKFINLGNLNYSIHREGFSDQYFLEERFNQKPALKAVLDTFTASVANTEMVAAMIANKHFEVAGSNMTTALSTLATNGGFTMTTAGGANTTDAAYVWPQTSTNQTAWKAVVWSQLKNVRFEATIETEAAIVTDGVIYAGLKLTGTDTLATDANQAIFRYNVASSAFWQTSDTNNAGTANTQTTTVTVANSTVYHLAIQVDGNRIPRYYINSVLVATGAALKSTVVSFLPIIGCRQTASGSDIALTVHGVRCSRDY